jgi:hypothetical protein
VRRHPLADPVATLRPSLTRKKVMTMVRMNAVTASIVEVATAAA